MAKQKKTKKSVKETKLDLGAAQKAAVNALLSTFSSQHILHSAGISSDPDEVMNLIYAGANHLAVRVKNIGSNDLGNPTEMRIRVKHDPSIDETQIGFSFFKSIFTVYTPEDISKEINFGDLSFTLEDQLRNQLVDRLPSAEARLALTIAEVCSQGGRDSYIQRFLPRDLKSVSKSTGKKKLQKKIQKKGVRRVRRNNNR